MQVTVSLYALEGGAFESQKIKICLLPDSGSQGKENKSKILASCRLDLSNLRLQCNGDEGEAWYTQVYTYVRNCNVVLLMR